MKKISKIFIFSALILSGIWACKKEENRVILKGGTAPVLTASVADSIPLSYATRDNEAFQLSWTNPNYQFNTGVSSLDVTSTIEIDTAGANFTNPNKQVISLGTDLSKTFTQSQFNDYLLNTLRLDTSVSHNIEIRVTSSLVGGAEPLVSQVLSFKVIPYAIPAKVAPPASESLFIVGSATPGGDTHGWDNPVSQPAVQQFTRLNKTLYTLTIPLIGDKEYKFISVNGSWDSDKQWSIKTEQASGDPSTLNYDLYPNGGNVRAPLLSANYKIDVDFQRGKVTLTKK
jgi:starch-binding outer membrane protein SusE/F